MDIMKYIDQDALDLFLKGWSCDAYKFFGCHKTEDGKHLFVVWAPNAWKVCLVGDFCNWNWDDLPMYRLDCGVWAIVIDNAKHGDIYKYAVTRCDGTRVLKADPFAFHAETGMSTGSKVWDIEGFKWHDAKYINNRNKTDILTAPMSIYELHIGSWKIKEGQVYPNYAEIADELADYCEDMGYTHVELLPITEYPYEMSWGYQVTGYFAPTSRYGTPQDFMSLVDKLHKRGIGVIIDWVPAHFPRDEHGLAYFDGSPVFERNNSWMASHPHWGTLIFDYDKPAVQSFLMSSAAMFMDEYHIDGMRIDAVTSMLYLSYGREDNYVPNCHGGNIDLGAIEILHRLNALAKSRNVFTIAEESAAYPLVTAPAADGGLGFTFKWDMGFMHDTLDYMQVDPYFRSSCHNKMTFSMMYCFSERFVLAYSHDEVVHGKRSMVDKMWGDYDSKFASLRTLFGFQYAHPGKKHNFMGSEFGQFIEWNPTQQLDWILLDYPRHAQMHNYMRELGKIYLAHPEFYQNETNWLGFKWLNVNDNERSSLAFMRTGFNGEKTVCIFNFTPNTWDFQIGLPSKGSLKLLLNSDDECFGGSGMKVKTYIRTRKKPFFEHPHTANITLPANSALYYTFIESEEKA
ncbi:MAG: 1,4-alpha-glucan branching protein GlgB [Oscillospiraceae bacterium]|nr:1,4-alpha-glucan branching protein GlgB [Oscillospiraceae bacterium]